jgi:hypothetical protein
VSVINLNSGKVRHLLRHRLVETSMTASGHHLAYGDSKGRVWWLNLKTGKRTLVFDAKVGYKTRIEVSSCRRWVGWDIGRATGSGTRINGMRHVGTSKPVSLRHDVYRMTSSGALLTDQPGLSSFRDGAHPVWLRTYDRKTIVVRAGNSYEELPQVAGRVITWLESTSDRRIASFTLP